MDRELLLIFEEIRSGLTQQEETLFDLFLLQEPPRTFSEIAVQMGIPEEDCREHVRKLMDRVRVLVSRTHLI